MRLKPEENIDKEARIPDGIEFRAELLWSKIEEKQNPKKKKPVFWWVAAACAILAIGYSIYPGEEEAVRSESLISETLEPKIQLMEEEVLAEEVSKLAAMVPKKVEPSSGPKLAENGGVPSDSEPKVGLELPEPQKVALPLIAITPTIEEPAEPKLSPAALRLQRSLQKLDPNKSAGQTLIVEKFNLFRELQRYPTQAATNQKSTSVISHLIKGKNENN